jgi:hypothetical protein
MPSACPAVRGRLPLCQAGGRSSKPGARRDGDVTKGFCLMYVDEASRGGNCGVSTVQHRVGTD